VALAAQWVEQGQRLELQPLAAELGVSRVTLFRRVGNREALLGAALWSLTQRALRTAERRWDRRRVAGPRAAGVLELFNGLVAAASGLRRLLDDEPAVTIRILTDPHGPVQPGVIAWVEALLRRDDAEAGLPLLIESGDLAFALVRLGESFLYADVIASRRPDVNTANRLQRALIDAGRQGDY
jgi:AcrR family transcriptional regulator